MSIKSVLTSIGIVVSCAVWADGLAVQSTVEQGKWCGDFPAARDYAEANNIPMLVFWASQGCGQCAKLEKACLESDFLSWQAERKFVMVFAEGKTTEAQLAAYNWIKSVKGLRQFPFIGVYWKANASGQTVESVFVGRKGTMPVTSGTLQEQLMKSVDQLTDGWTPGGVTPTPTPTPTPTVDVREEAYGEKQSFNALVSSKTIDAYLGTAAISLGKIKDESVKVTVKVTLFSGKTYTAKQTVAVAKDGSASGGLTFKDPIGGMAFALAYDATANKCAFAAAGDYLIETIDGTIGGPIAASSLVFSAPNTKLLPPEGYAFVTDTAVNELVYIQDGTKFSFAKAAKLSYKKVNGAYVLQGLDDQTRTNVSGLKLTYKSATGLFSGSFKLYASNAASVGGSKPKLGKYTATVKGAMVNGVGYGAYTIKIGGTSYDGTCVIK